ncbi:lactonase family protein [Gemella sp. zg-570]|uniref:lactonase family protein n=1 Tax=Gemella sp. zg-570 TaxID=2840371 RepID=UPI001C0DF3D5|nr:lactonase family protein [Gemella sp. zg-570]QWQ38705.1 lactonase family protein [Gemella sp. zg-570]
MIEKFYLGTYTKRISQGIYSIKLDKVNKKLFDLKLEYSVNNPTYLVTSKENIFTVSTKESLGGLTYFKNGKKIADHHSENSGPCYIAYDEKNNFLLTANYHTASLILYEINKDKIILLDKIIHEGKSSLGSQEKSHIHYSNFSSDKKFIVACDLGTDSLITYKIENKKLLKVATYKATEKSGARHLVFHPQKDIAYLICELNASIEILNFDKVNGSFTKKDGISLVENDEKKWAAAIRITKDGKKLYASNRGKDVLLAFKIEDDGLLNHIQTVDTLGSVARDFNLSSDDKFLLVGHQESDNLTLFERNEDGRLKCIEKNIFAPEVVNIVNKN